MRRFLYHRSAVLGLVFIVLVALLGTFAYTLAPDNSPSANQIQLPLALKQPGFSCGFIRLKKSNSNELGSFLSGCEKNYEAIPINTVKVLGDSIQYEEYDLPEDSLNSLKSVATESLLKNGNDYIFNQTFWLGTDRYGRDMLSRMLVGARVSLAVGFVAVFISGLLGLILGLVAGYFRGRTDAIISWLISVVWALPTLLIVISITLALGKGFWQIFIAVGLTIWVEVARLVRGQVISLREKDFVDAAHALGASDFRIIFRHLLPNLTGPLIVICTANFAAAILLEAGLSFLGIGIQPPEPSWGQMLREHYGYIVLDLPYLAIIPGAAIMLLVIAFNMVGDGLREALDIRD